MTLKDSLLKSEQLEVDPGLGSFPSTGPWAGVLGLRSRPCAQDWAALVCPWAQALPRSSPWAARPQRQVLSLSQGRGGTPSQPPGAMGGQMHPLCVWFWLVVPPDG